ncbi:major facilitator superfamily transporter, partial [Aureobasidium melanogenum]
MTGDMDIVDIPGFELTAEDYARKQKALVRKIDFRLMPCLLGMIVLNYLDRNALPNARIQGIEKDLGLKGDQFNTAISVLFAGYIALQIPSNMLLTRVRPSIYLPVCMALWGVVSACTALVHNFDGLVVTRFFLGFMEAPYFPGALFLLSSWYTRRELATRTAVLYTGSLLSSGFGGLVGAGVQYGLDGARGLESWRWLFIIEGSVTVAFALTCILILPDFPHTTRWLSEEEKAIATYRLRDRNGNDDAERGSLLSGVRMAVIDYKVWLLAGIVITKTSAAAVTSFIPTLVKTFGYNKINSLLLVAPPYVFAAFCAMGISISSDRRQERYAHLVIPLAFGMIGYIIAAATTTLAPRYVSLFLMLGGVYGGFNVAIAWISATLPHPMEKRAAALALTNMVGNFAQIYSPYLYEQKSGPRYLPAMEANTVFVAVSIILATILRFCLVRENRKLEQAEIEQINLDLGEKSNVEHMEVSEVRPAPGLSPGFRYLL